MAGLRDDSLKKLEFLEDNKLLTLNNSGDYVGSGGLGYSFEIPKKDINNLKIYICLSAC
jgi:hypothetical protein